MASDYKMLTIIPFHKLNIDSIESVGKLFTGVLYIYMINVLQHVCVLPDLYVYIMLFFKHLQMVHFILLLGQPAYINSCWTINIYIIKYNISREKKLLCINILPLSTFRLMHKQRKNLFILKSFLNLMLYKSLVQFNLVLVCLNTHINNI